eukprot:RCo047497
MWALVLLTQTVSIHTSGLLAFTFAAGIFPAAFSFFPSLFSFPLVFPMSMEAFVNVQFQAQGIKVLPEWIRDAVTAAPCNTPESVLSHVLQYFLHSDLNIIGLGVLHTPVGEMQDGVVDGPIVLQVDDFADISESTLDGASRIAIEGCFGGAPKRCLKLACTDGRQRLFAMEFRPCEALRGLRVGAKLQLRNINVCRGLLLLVPGTLNLLGGAVSALEEAFQVRLQHRLAVVRGKPYLTGVPSSGVPSAPGSFPEIPRGVPLTRDEAPSASVVAEFASDTSANAVRPSRSLDSVRPAAQSRIHQRGNVGGDVQPAPAPRDASPSVPTKSTGAPAFA